MNTKAKYLKPGQKFRFKGEKIINEFIEDDRLEMHFVSVSF